MVVLKGTDIEEHVYQSSLMMAHLSSPPYQARMMAHLSSLNVFRFCCSPYQANKQSDPSCLISRSATTTPFSVFLMFGFTFQAFTGALAIHLGHRTKRRLDHDCESDLRYASVR